MIFLTFLGIRSSSSSFSGGKFLIPFSHLGFLQVHSTGPGVIKLFPCSTQLITKFILLINVKMPTIVGILTFISMINTTHERLKAETSLLFGFCFVALRPKSTAMVIAGWSVHLTTLFPGQA